MHKTVHTAHGTKTVHLGGWKRQTEDTRDYAYRLKIPRGAVALPSSVDLRATCSPVVDQGELGSCTANMFAGLVEYNEIKRVGQLHEANGAAKQPAVTVSGIAAAADGSVTFSTKVTPASVAPAPAPAPTPAPKPTLTRASRLFEYYGTRKIEHTTGTDSGASIRDAIKCGALYGVADEAAYPYDVAAFAVNPPMSIWTAALAHKVTSYHSIADGDVATMKATLAAGLPIGFGFEVYDYFLSAEMAAKGVLDVPKATEKLQGGHAVCLVGYDDSKSAFLVRNSWGNGWGPFGGYYWMAYQYVGNANLTSDFWVVASTPF